MTLGGQLACIVRLLDEWHAARLGLPPQAIDERPFGAEETKHRPVFSPEGAFVNSLGRQPQAGGVPPNLPHFRLPAAPFRGVNTTAACPGTSHASSRCSAGTP